MLSAILKEALRGRGVDVFCLGRAGGREKMGWRLARGLVGSRCGGGASTLRPRKMTHIWTFEV